MPVEPPHLGANMDSRVVGVLVADEGDNTWDLIVQDGQTLKLGCEVTSASYSSGHGPWRRSGFSTVFSRSVGGVFFLGGTHYFTGESLHDVALHRWGVG